MELYPYFTEELLELVFPKKVTIHQTKCREHLLLMVVEGEPLFFQQFDGPLIPSLRVLHKCKSTEVVWFPPCILIPKCIFSPSLLSHN